MQDINENNQKEESCRRHEFEHEKINGLLRYRCKNCGCVEDVSFVKGYMRGLEHENQENQSRKFLERIVSGLSVVKCLTRGV